MSYVASWCAPHDTQRIRTLHATRGGAAGQNPSFTPRTGSRSGLSPWSEAECSLSSAGLGSLLMQSPLQRGERPQQNAPQVLCTASPPLAKQRFTVLELELCARGQGPCASLQHEMHAHASPCSKSAPSPLSKQRSLLWANEATWWVTHSPTWANDASPRVTRLAIGVNRSPALANDSPSRVKPSPKGAIVSPGQANTPTPPANGPTPGTKRATAGANVPYRPARTSAPGAPQIQAAVAKGFSSALRP